MGNGKHSPCDHPTVARRVFAVMSSLPTRQKKVCDLMICFQRLRAYRRMGILSAIGVVVGLVVIYLASIAIVAEWSRAAFDREAQQLRRLKNSDELRLAETLDRSVVQISVGDFIMGCDTGRVDESPQHVVYLDAFEIDRYEVTNIQYRRFLQTTGRKAPQYWIGDDYPRGQPASPAVGVSWEDADAYCVWMGRRLPSEAEWEKACRGTDGRIYPWGDTWDPSRANVDVSLQTPAPAGSDEPEISVWDLAWKLLRATPTGLGQLGLRPIGSYVGGASPYGVMDMVGNASEWVGDWYNWSDYSKMPARNPHSSGPPWNHCVRGSAWHDPAGNAAWVVQMSRCSARSSSHTSADPRVGFRCARSIAGASP